MRKNKVYLGDCLQIMKHIPDKYIDCIICDLPYGTTACKWDVIIPFDLLWNQYNRIIKDHGAIVLFGIEPFSSYLRLSNIKNYKYDWIWEKSKGSNFIHSKYQPLRTHETISIFSSFPAAQNSAKKNMSYYPQYEFSTPYHYGINNGRRKFAILNGGISNKKNKEIENKSGKRYPRSVIYFRTAESEGSIHPTQKPVSLIEYLIKTYTKEQELVLDNCIGSGTTAIAAINTNRNWIGIEKDEEYFQKANERISKHLIDKEDTFFNA